VKFPESLKNFGFTDVPIELQPRVVWDVSGPEKVGKTKLGLGAPGRVAMQDFDEGADKTIAESQLDEAGEQRVFRSTVAMAQPGGVWGLAQVGADLEKIAAKSADDKTIYSDDEFDSKLHFETKRHNLPLVLKTLGGARAVAESGFFRSYFLDTQDEFYGLLRLAHFGRLAKVPSILYERVYNDFAGLVRTFKRTNMNFIMSSKVEPEWDGPQTKREKTGRLVRKGCEAVPFLIEEYFEARAYDVIDAKTQKVDGKRFVLRLMQSANKPEMVGREWVDERIVFADIAAELKPDVPPEAWYDGWSPA
jgi:hypothetical protein